MQRREFIISGLSFSAWAYITANSSWAKAAGKNLNLSPYLVLADSPAAMTSSYQQDKDAERANVIPGSIAFRDLKANKTESYEVPIWAHVYDQHPTRPNIFVGAAKWTPLAAVFDYAEKKAVAQLKAPEGYRFFGHSCFSPDGKYVYLTAANEKKWGGLCVYDCANWQLKKVVDTGGYEPHECLVTPDKKYICIAHTNRGKGDIGNICMLDVKTLKVAKDYSGPDASHIYFADKDNALFTGRASDMRPQIYTFDFAKKTIINFRDSKNFAPDINMASEGLSVCPLSKDSWAITLGDIAELMIWNTTKNEFQVRPFKYGAVGLARLDKNVYLNSSLNNQLVTFTIADEAGSSKLQVQDTPMTTIGNGRHMRLVYL